MVRLCAVIVILAELFTIASAAAIEPRKSYSIGSAGFGAHLIFNFYHNCVPYTNPHEEWLKPNECNNIGRFSSFNAFIEPLKVYEQQNRKCFIMAYDLRDCQDNEWESNAARTGEISTDFAGKCAIHNLHFPLYWASIQLVCPDDLPADQKLKPEHGLWIEPLYQPVCLPSRKTPDGTLDDGNC